jgi:hypothetical protein
MGEAKISGIHRSDAKYMDTIDKRILRIIQQDDRQQSVSGARQLRGSAAAPVVALQA